MGRIPTGVTTRPREDRRRRSYIVAVEIDLEHMRFGELFGFVTPLLVASALAPQLTHRSVSLLDRRMAALARPASVGGLALAGAILLAISSVLLRSGVAPEARAVTPAAAIAAVRASHVEGPALTSRP